MRLAGDHARSGEIARNARGGAILRHVARFEPRDRDLFDPGAAQSREGFGVERLALVEDEVGQPERMGEDRASRVVRSRR